MTVKELRDILDKEIQNGHGNCDVINIEAKEYEDYIYDFTYDLEYVKYEAETHEVSLNFSEEYKRKYSDYED